MSKNIIFITGGSRGIGAAMARAWSGEQTELHLFSRSTNQKLEDELTSKGAEVHWHSMDLSQTEKSTDFFTQLLEKIDWENYSSVWLFNNAGMLEPIGKVGKKDVTTLTKHIALNVSTPLAWSHEFANILQEKKIEKWIINIGSGAANKPYFGWAPYGAGKAALHHFASTMGVEQEKEDHPIHVITFNPGRTDTDMQGLIRETDEEDFLHVKSFVEAYEQGQLNNPDDLAKGLYDFCQKGNFEQGQIVSHRDI